MTRQINIILILTGSLLFIGCKRPHPCFDYSQAGPTVVTLDASCSENAYHYHWTIDTIERIETTNPILTYTFTKPGDYFINLTVGNKKDKPRRGFSMEVPHISKTITVK